MKNLKFTFHELKSFLLLWSTQSLSTLGSSMTNFALVIWSLSGEGVGAYDRSAVRLLLCALCADEYFCRRFQ